MPVPTHAVSRNRLLSGLSRAEYGRLQPSLVRVVLDADAVLHAPGEVVEYVYFPDDAIVSLLLAVDGRRTVEVAMQGSEGAVGFAAHLGGTGSRDLSVVREAGTAMRLDVEVLRRRDGRREGLRALLHKSLHALLAQVAQVGVCGRFHSVEARLARWLLMSHDRVARRGLLATQESIARALGVRRSGVSAAASGFHEHGVIETRRGRIEILDRRRLRAIACPCYGIIKHQYDSVLGG